MRRDKLVALETLAASTERENDKHPYTYSAQKQLLKQLGYDFGNGQTKEFQNCLKMIRPVSREASLHPGSRTAFNNAEREWISWEQSPRWKIRGRITRFQGRRYVGQHVTTADYSVTGVWADFIGQQQVKFMDDILHI
ncbi:hypothetical protein Bbelb_204570 [Branchiostoma belcheri]|nr:hypothetical protein Bbelb_204570 [Branchiostoma belcheri]